ncbi:prolyl oligopeptidase family serine peptidase [Longimicrobium sp.]|uniref:prolyl oligopeptidase family serine peptidase n=1 Tax=Longimicrobium sp. TaxID=2029185 RepID=UPI002C9A2199|nr:prolyl oligopeptidase family serine peptidase [Longimicrobium sp.]HSU17872.1 prolyl oligopeptidase family serine peptidase [Longimicrobium sp.]
MTPSRSLGAALAALAVAATASAQTAAPARTAPAFELTVASIMRGPLLVGRSPDEVRWSADSRAVWYRWREPEARDTATHLYRVAAEGGAPVAVADTAAFWAAPAETGRWTAARTRRAEERSGDIFVVDADGRTRRITQTPARERGAHLSPDGRTVYFLSSNNVWAVDVDGGGPVRQITDLRTDDAPKQDTTKGQRGYLENQQRELFGVIRDRRAQRLHGQEVDSLRRGVPPVYLGKNSTVASAEVSPSGRYLLLGVGQRVEGEKAVIVANFVTESGYTDTLKVRGKVGEVQAFQRAAMVDLATGRVSWIEPEAKERKLTLTALSWSPRSDRALLMGIPADYKDRWIYVAGPDAKTTTIDHIHDDAWVGGPGFFSAGWLPDERVWFVSERTGWAHLYTVGATGGDARAVTAGRWEVRDVQLSRDGRTFFVATSETHPGEQNLYAVSADGGARTRLTPLDGWTDAQVSPDGRWIALLRSTADAPPELYLMPNRAGAQPRQVTRSTTAEFRTGPWIRPQVVEVPTRDGQTAYARIYRPRELGAQPNGAAILFVHGAGYLQDAHRGWSTYYREYLFNHLLASRGYTVMDVDYRGSAGYGAAWRTGIYRHMGGKDLDDEVDAARWLVANEGVDAKRIGMYGGSYGGFMTLMALFTQPDVIRSGAALRSVTNWANYNHGYTSRILNLPQDDSVAYRQSSPIYFAEGLKGDLLMLHGMVDTNVNFQDIVELNQRLIELGKTHWELAVYPVEDHGFVRPESWTDEYRRILELFERTLQSPAR